MGSLEESEEAYAGSLVGLLLWICLGLLQPVGVIHFHLKRLVWGHFGLKSLVWAPVGESFFGALSSVDLDAGSLATWQLGNLATPAG